MTKFKIITLAIFIICIIVGVLTFALYKGNQSSSALPPITIWGTFSQDVFNNYVASINNSISTQLSITYIQERPDTFGDDFVNALATGRGPDAILIPADMILPEENKLTPIPFTALPERTFRDSYIQEANLYISPNGILAVPFTVDPLMMYWNRDTFNAAGIATYPRYWDEFTGTAQSPGLVQKLTITDQNSTIRKTAIAMGNFSNITNAREVLGSLLLQLGNPVTVASGNGMAVSTVKTAAATDPTPALQYFSQFVDPTSPNYSWNAGMSNDKTAFLSGISATYFGFASELGDIRGKNPNLNFDIAPLPQVRASNQTGAAGQKATYGKIYGFSLVRASTNVNVAYQVISILTSPQYIAGLSQNLYLPSVRTDVIAQGSTDPYIKMFNDSALVAKSWLDVDPTMSRKLFASLIQAIVSGQKNTSQAIDDAGASYDVILQKAAK